jgi:hypothetical protein
MENDIIRTENLLNVPALLIAAGNVTIAHGGAMMSKIIPPTKCLHCGKVFQPKRVTGKYCSRLCVHNSWIERHKNQWREYNEQWRQSNSDYWKKYYQDGRGVEVQKRRHDKHPLERKARTAVSNALRLGKLARPEHCQIRGCDNTRLEAHHWKGYEPENWLNVQWLCHKHHLEAADDS